MKHIHRPKLASVTDELFEYRHLDKKKLKLSLLITFIAMIVEIIGGLLTNSLALISDAGHMVTHCFALGVSLGAIICADRPSCHTHTFGFYRVEILAALFNSVFLFIVTFWILIEAIKRILHPSPILSFQMLIVAVMGLIVNLVSMWILQGGSKNDLNVRSAAFHMMGDALSSLVVVIGAVIINFTHSNIIDPILSIGVAGVIFLWAGGLFKDSVNILLEAAPAGIDVEQVSIVLKKSIPEIKEITDMHVWVITSNMYSMTAHIKFDDNLTKDAGKEILKKIRETVDKEFNIEHTTIEIEQV